jgi:hypothetical protein
MRQEKGYSILAIRSLKADRPSLAVHVSGFIAHRTLRCERRHIRPRLPGTPRYSAQFVAHHLSVQTTAREAAEQEEGHVVCRHRLGG